MGPDIGLGQLFKMDSNSAGKQSCKMLQNFMINLVILFSDEDPRCMGKVWRCESENNSKSAFNSAGIGESLICSGPQFPHVWNRKG